MEEILMKTKGESGVGNSKVLGAEYNDRRIT